MIIDEKSETKRLKFEENKTIHKNDEENLAIPRIKLFERENWNFDSYSIDDHSKVLEYIYKSYSGKISSIDITRSDISRLKEGCCFNDILVNFYLRHLEQECIPDSVKKRVHIFSSYFYEKLKKTNAESRDDKITNYLEVSKWTKHIDIFSYDFLIIPICEGAHWKTAIVCYPRAVFDNAINFYTTRKIDSQIPRKNTSIIFLSSISGDIRIQSQIIKSYIEMSYFYQKMSAEHREIFKKYEGFEKLCTSWNPKVPKQDNSVDCGVFAIMYVEEFLKNPDEIAMTISVFLLKK